MPQCIFSTKIKAVGGSSRAMSIADFHTNRVKVVPSSVGLRGRFLWEV